MKHVKRKSSLIRKLIVSALFLCAGGLLGVGAVFYHLSLTLPNIGPLLEGYRPLETTRILAADGTLIGELFEERRTVVPLERIPKAMVDAVLAAEDADFRSHKGLDYPGILRAILNNLKSGKLSQGASTITQQVARTFFLTREKTYSRKIREILLTKRIEDRLTKDEILFLYLNQINFGHARYGVQEAAGFYFSKDIKDIGLAEAALLAAIPKGPTIYSPITHPDAAMSRRTYVLNEMAKHGFINEEQKEEAMTAPIGIVKGEGMDALLSPEAVKRALFELEGVVSKESLKRGGYVIETTLNPMLQRAAREALIKGLQEIDSRHGRMPPYKASKRRKGAEDSSVFDLQEGRTYIAEVVGQSDEEKKIFAKIGDRKGVIDLEKASRYNPKKLSASSFAAVGTRLPVSLASEPGPQEDLNLQLEEGPQAALAAIDSSDGSIAALVGGYRVLSGGFDRATEARRQPGSAFKPFVYLAALIEGGYTAATLLDDAPEVQGEWKPDNSKQGEYAGTIRLRQAIARSLNLPTIKLITAIGPEKVVDVAGKLGITSKLDPTPSLALGTSVVSPLEMAGAYSAFARGGKRIDPWIVKRVTAPDGTEIPLMGRTGDQVVSQQEAYLVTSLLKSVIEEGTATAGKELNRPAAGKTGTTDEERDAWFVGYTPDYSCAVWVGFDDLRPIGRKEYGARAALPIWLDFMKQAHQGKEPQDFVEPEGIVKVPIDPATGLLAYEGMTNSIEEIFIEGTEPSQKAVAPGLIDPGSFIMDQMSSDTDSTK